MRNGPLVRRSAHASRVTQAAATRVRPTAALRSRCKQASLTKDLPMPDLSSSGDTPCAHLECRLPINLRQFLAEQMGPALQAEDDNLLKLAATADRATLSKLARAIRRYSTERAHEAWAESAVALSRFMPAEGNQAAPALLCLRCGCVDFAADNAKTHQAPGCLTVNLEAAAVPAGKTNSRSAAEAAVANHLQRLIEEFRALRVAFGLPHFELDNYVKNHQVIFTWRPLPTA
jgi:hypothetical protein